MRACVRACACACVRVSARAHVCLCECMRACKDVYPICAYGCARAGVCMCVYVCARVYGACINELMNQSNGFYYSDASHHCSKTHCIDSLYVIYIFVLGLWLFEFSRVDNILTYLCAANKHL